MTLIQFPRLLLVALLVCALGSARADEDIEEIVVTADYRERPLAELPASASVLDGEQVEALAVQHFEELVGVVPNVNWSGDGHRARYLQIRGVGELEQYQGAPNPSVGLLIDDIDFSGIGTIATLFDIERVEVLRGPQGSRYGANALGGLVYLQSAVPSAERDGRLQLSAGGDDAFSAGAAIGGPLSDDGSAAYRLSAHHHRSNGFRDNPYLGRDDTNGRDETTVRGRLRLQPSDAVEINVAAMFADVDDGYDAFALDNSYTMLSDKPGRDAQQSIGASLRIDFFAESGTTFTSLTSFARSDIDFSFDADWGNEDSWAPFVYDFVSLNDRRRRTLSQELRIASEAQGDTDWLVGLYALRLDDDLDSLNAGDYDDGVFPFTLLQTLDSRYEATNVALFGQADRRLSAATRLSAGLRLENRTTDYSDSDGLDASPSEFMVGGELTLSHDISDAVTGYASLSRGYKAGGFNLGLVPDALREFGKEALWNVEAGFRSASPGKAFSWSVAAFHSQRIDQQVRLSFQLNPNDPASFGFATVNADGTASGVEAELRWVPSDRWQLYANVGLLDTRIDRIELPGFIFKARDNAHAPRYTLAAGAAYRHPSGWFGRVDASGKDDFYFDVSHNEKSRPYEIVNARFGYAAGPWTAQIWVRNVFDERYAVRGFFFGNEPPDFAPTLYTRLGDPRQVGVTIDWRFGS